MKLRVVNPRKFVPRLPKPKLDSKGKPIEMKKEQQKAVEAKKEEQKSQPAPQNP
jgi:hypothetical protein